MNTFREFCYDRHDNYANQKYGDNLPYSFHLNCVYQQARKFEKLILGRLDYGHREYDIVYNAVHGHDLEEDTRITYNNIVSKLESFGYENQYAIMIADIIHCVTDEKGKSRGDRKNEKYYRELNENKLAVFVKLSDIAANTLYSKLTGSDMYKKYKREFPNFKEKCYIDEYKQFFEYVENL